MSMLAAWLVLASPAPAAGAPVDLDAPPSALAPADSRTGPLVPTPSGPTSAPPDSKRSADVEDQAADTEPVTPSQTAAPPARPPRTPPPRARRGRLRPLPAARAIFGAALPAAPAAPPAFSLDLALGTQVTGPRDLGLASEFGYTLLHRGDHLDHRFGLGLGPLFRGQSGSAGLLARGLLGSARGELIGGLRLALVGGLARDLLAFEIGQEWTWGGPGPTRALRLGVGLNFVQIFGALLGVSIVRAMTPRGRRWW